MRVYVAGPISNGDSGKMGYQTVVDNIRQAIMAGDELADLGYAPFVPHLTHFWNLIMPRHYQSWLDIDDEWVVVSDAVLRIPGASKGADREVELAKNCGIPVFYSVQALDDALHHKRDLQAQQEAKCHT